MEVSRTFSERGQQYGDTWRDCQWLAMLATARSMDIDLTADEARRLAAAALVDVKYQRLQGGYKRDTGVDQIAYLANWLAEMASTPDAGPGGSPPVP